MRTSLAVNRRCGFRSARIFNALFGAAMLDGSCRNFGFKQDKMAMRNRVRHTV
jgi:hypothetical protein